MPASMLRIALTANSNMANNFSRDSLFIGTLFSFGVGLLSFRNLFILSIDGDNSSDLSACTEVWLSCG